MVDVHFARWSRVSDLSVEPWMNQPDHSHPTETKVQISGGGLIGCCEPPDLGAENYWPIAEHRLLLTKHQVISAVL